MCLFNPTKYDIFHIKQFVIKLLNNEVFQMATLIDSYCIQGVSELVVQPEMGGFYV